MNKKTNKIIGLFGSSFNPPHCGHLAVIKDLSQKDIFDEIWLIPVFDHAFGKKLASFEARLEMLRLFCEELDPNNVKISTIERDLNKQPSYTSDVAQALISQNPNHEFHLILGSDTIADLPKWHESQKLQDLVHIYPIPRAGYQNSIYPNVSSSQIRERLAAKQTVEGLVPTPVTNYLINNSVYKTK